tara:strand:- start:4427 stop:5059 length:633 start_codon:yes stop_codon:yes gene_type:complete
MYNVGDIGLNTCDGEGFGLCNFEQAGVGVPQIVPNIGGFKDFFIKGKNSILIDPKWTYYCDHSRDFVAGEAEVCDVDDYVNALEFYYTHRKLITNHGQAARENILSNYSWTSKGKHLYDIIMEETRHMETSAPKEEKQKLELKNIDINELIKSKLNVNPIAEEDLKIVEGGEESESETTTYATTSKQQDIDVDNMSYDDMKQILKKMLKN